MVSTISAVSGHGEIAYGNAIGSAICNTALICALTIAIAPSVVHRDELILPVVLFFVASVIYMISAYGLGFFPRALGIVLLVVFVIYMVLNIWNTKRKAQKGAAQAEPAVKEDEEAPAKELSLGMQIFYLVLGAVLIAVGARLLVDNGTIIAEGLGVPESVIALIFVALGTSLPELVTAVTSLVKGHGAVSLGNICGANFFNLALVSGLSVTIAPFSLPQEKVIAIGDHLFNASLVVDIPVMFLVMILLTIPALVKEKLYRWQGILLLILYVVFCSYQIFG